MGFSFLVSIPAKYRDGQQAQGLLLTGDGLAHDTSMSKYGAEPTNIGGIKFASKAEAQRYMTLIALEKAGKIRDLILQPKFVLMTKFKYHGKAIRGIKYVADFQYREGEMQVVEDVKGMKTPAYELKLKLFLSLYGENNTFREIIKGKVIEL